MANNTPLGKGLSALISSQPESVTKSAYNEKFDINNLDPNPYQPRMHIKPEDLIELADSIREKGIIEPLIITESDKRGRYYVIAGERRLRAAQLAGLEAVPVVIKDTSPQEMLELALIENIQRQDLNALEEATAFKHLQDEFGLTQKDIAKKVGLSRVAVTNKIRLLGLPDQVKEAILNTEISEGHARALLGLTDKQSLIAATSIVIKRKLSVRETEQLVRKINQGKDSSKTEIDRISEQARLWEAELSKKLGFSARITKLNTGGKLTIRYNNDKELEKLIENLL